MASYLRMGRVRGIHHSSSSMAAIDHADNAGRSRNYRSSAITRESTGLIDAESIALSGSNLVITHAYVAGRGLSDGISINCGLHLRVKVPSRYAPER